MAKRMLEWGKDIVLFVLVLCMLAQSAYILVLNQRYPGNTGTISTLRMLWQDLGAAGALDPGLARERVGQRAVAVKRGAAGCAAGGRVFALPNGK